MAIVRNLVLALCPFWPLSLAGAIFLVISNMNTIIEYETDINIRIMQVNL